MPIFNFKQFNESNTQTVLLTEEHRLIMQDILDDIWALEVEIIDHGRFGSPKVPDVSRSNICLRSSVKYIPGEIVSLVDYTLAPELIESKSSIYGFSIRIWEKHKHLLKRCLEVFKRQTGIELSTYTNDERQTIIAETEVIKFIKNILDFEISWEELDYMLPEKYRKDVFIEAESSELQIQIHFPNKDSNNSFVGCYLELNLSRGLVIGTDLPIDDNVKYKLTIGRLWNFQEKRDNPEILKFYESLKDKEYTFEFDVGDPDYSNEEIISFINDKILSQIELEDAKFKSQIEYQLKSLEQWFINTEIEYIKNDLIQVELTWKKNQYTFYLYLNKLGEQDLDKIISIKQGDKWLDKSSVEDLAETIYLALIENKLKVV